MGIVNLDKLTFWRVRPIYELANGCIGFLIRPLCWKLLSTMGIHPLCGSYLTSSWIRLLGGLMDILSVNFVVVLTFNMTIHFIDFVKNFNRFGGPSTFWAVLLSSWWSIQFFVAVISPLKAPSILWTCKKFTVSVIHPLCGQFFYRRGDPSTLWRLYHL